MATYLLACTGGVDAELNCRPRITALGVCSNFNPVNIIRRASNTGVGAGLPSGMTTHPQPPRMHELNWALGAYGIGQYGLSPGCGHTLRRC